MSKTKLIFSAAGALALLASDAAARPARCVITSNGVVSYKGKCDFTPMTGNGGFSVSPVGRQYFPGGVAPISVAKLTMETAEVRGLTRDGINSRWGDATRLKKDPACWDGGDFRICVY